MTTGILTQRGILKQKGIEVWKGGDLVASINPEVGGTGYPVGLLLGNGSQIEAWNVDYNSKRNIIYLDVFDRVRIGTTDELVNIDGPVAINYGSGAVASAGVIRLRNNQRINWRNPTGTGDVEGIWVDTDSMVHIGSGGAHFNNQGVRGVYDIEVNGGGNAAQSGALRLTNEHWIKARNQGNTDDVGLIRLNSSNVIEFGGTSSVLGDLILLNKLLMGASNAGIEIGSTAQANTPYIDFHTGANDPDFDVRIIASGYGGSQGSGGLRFVCGQMGFYGAGLASKQTVTGSRGGNAALQSLLSALATIGLITDSSS